jgi:hypothetical protein
MGLAKFDTKVRQWRTLGQEAGGKDGQFEAVLNAIQWRAFQAAKWQIYAIFL